MSPPRQVPTPVYSQFELIVARNVRDNSALYQTFLTTFFYKTGTYGIKALNMYMFMQKWYAK